MSFVNPLALLLLLPAAGFAVWFILRHGQGGFQLPGHWSRVISDAMRAFMVRQVVAPKRHAIMLWLALWVLITLALARPEFDSGGPEDYGNLAGRVIALDLGADVDIEALRTLAYRIFDASPTTPTGLVLATGEAFDVVPLTTDRTHLVRYLQVTTPAVMPVSGRAPAIAIAHAEHILERAGVVAGQIVVLTGGKAPAAPAAAGGKWLRALVTDPAHLGDWRGYAAKANARLVDDTAIQQLIEDLDDQVQAALSDAKTPGELELARILTAVAACLWLLFFRRIRAS